jgi:tRNA(fMet)-specific endonuclease VapC
MYMLDTDTCSYIIHNRPITILAKFNALQTTDLCISVITNAELLFGVEKSSSKKINLEVVESFTSKLIILDWDVSAAKEYAKIRTHLKTKGKLIGNMDMLIAAHALSINATIVTNNTRHFQLIPNLKVENWL